MIRRTQAGLTLIEVLIVTVIVAIVGVAIGSLFMGTGETQARSLTRVSLQREYSMAMARITRVLRDAKWVTVGSAGAYADFFTPSGAGVTQGQIRKETTVLAIQTATDRACSINQRYGLLESTFRGLDILIETL